MIRAILLDLDGVLYEGEAAVAGAADAVRWIQDEGIPHLFVTNTTSRPREALARKLAGFGVSTDVDHILTPPVAALAYLERHVTGPVALFVPAATKGEFESLPVPGSGAGAGVAAVVIGDLGAGWDFATLNRAFRLLMADPPPALIALGMTRYWRAEDGLRLDAGAYVSALAYASGVEPVVMGKPARPFFEAALDRLGVGPGAAIMVGDDIRGDVDGAQRAGVKGVLVRTGKFQLSDLEQGLVPDAVIPSIAELPRRWDSLRAG